jgi:hypothetical protein
MSWNAGDSEDDFVEPEYLGDRRFLEFVGLGGFPAAGTIAGKAGPCPTRPDYLSDPTNLVLCVEEAWRTPYPDLSCEQVRTLLEQKMALEALADPILDFAARHPTAIISNYQGEIGLLVLRAAEDFLVHAPVRFRSWLDGDFGWMEEAFGWSRSLRREAEDALAAARSAAADLR